MTRVCKKFPATQVVFLWLVPFATGCFLPGCSVLDRATAERQARQKQEAIEKEFHLIQPPSGALPTSANVRFVHKNDRRVVGLSYKTDLSYPAIRRHYDAELARHGWKFQRGINVIYRGEDSGGKEAFYSKGEYTAILQFAGERELNEMGWNYVLDLSWGLHSWK
ncbi:MAG TPA: hypothetical protein VGJ55_10795 [Pyrinomonadaceae bacterium]|jgi:hypothetical protein